MRDISQPPRGTSVTPLRDTRQEAEGYPSRSWDEAVAALLLGLP